MRERSYTPSPSFFSNFKRKAMSILAYAIGYLSYFVRLYRSIMLQILDT